MFPGEKLQWFGSNRATLIEMTARLRQLHYEAPGALLCRLPSRQMQELFRQERRGSGRLHVHLRHFLSDVLKSHGGPYATKESDK